MAMGPNPKSYMTREATELFMVNKLKEFMKEEVEPRHQENQKSLKKIERLIYIGYGIFVTLIFILQYRK